MAPFNRIYEVRAPVGPADDYVVCAAYATIEEAQNEAVRLLMANDTCDRYYGVFEALV